MRPQTDGRIIAELLCRILTDSQHRTFGNGRVLARKGVMRREVQHRRLEEIELIRNERIGRDKRLLIGVGRIALRSVRKVEKNLEVRCVSIVKRRDFGDGINLLLQESPLDDFIRIGTCQGNLRLEPRSAKTLCRP